MTARPKHTPEPCAEIAELERLKRETPSCGPWIIQAETAEQNARIVACVNACAGLNPEAIPELIAACQRMVDGDRLDSEGIKSQAAAMARVALESVRGSK